MAENEIFDRMNDENLSPDDFIALMFERTDESGILYIPEWNFNDFSDEYSYRCKVDWSLYDCESTTNEFNYLFNNMPSIAKFYDEIDGDTENAKELLSDELFGIWDKYIRPFDVGALDIEKIREIEEKMDNIDWAKEISMRFAKGEKLDDYEKEVLTDYLNITVTSDELKLFREYINALFEDSKKRVGDSEYAYDVVLGAMRLNRLFSLGAPRIIIYAEARALAANMVMHKYGKSRELVDNKIRLNIERLDNMTDDELDELYRPKKTNSRKSMAPLYVYLILKDHSSNKHHLRQQEILRYLGEYPYEVVLERKALSRIVHNLIDSQLMIHSDQTGTWFEQE